MKKLFLRLGQFLSENWQFLIYCGTRPGNYYPCKLESNYVTYTEQNIAIIHYRIFGKKNLHTINAQQLSSDKDLIAKFSPVDALKIGSLISTSHSQIESNSQINNFSKMQILLTALYILLNITYFVLAPRIIILFGLAEPGGILIFPFTFLLADIITEVYGYAYARFLLWLTILSLGLFSLGVWLSLNFPTAYLNYGNLSIFSAYPRLFVGIALSTIAGVFINNYILAKLKILLSGRYYWWRSFLATAIGHAVFSIIWVLIFHTNKINDHAMRYLLLSMYIWKISCEIIATPICCIIASWLKNHENIDIYDNTTNFNPFYF